MSPDFASSTPVACDDKLTSVSETKGDEKLVDYSSSPNHMSLDINVVCMSLDYFVIPEEDLAHLDFGPKEATF